MKRLLLLSVMIFVLHISSNVIAADTAYVKTDKTMYLMDPYYWVYSAALCTLPPPGNINAGYWPIGGVSA